MDNINRLLANYRKKGEVIWFEKLYYCFMPKIYKYFYYRIDDRQIAEDLTNEVFLKVYKNLDTKKFNSRSFSVWLYKIAKNHLLDYFKKNSKERQFLVFSDFYEDSDFKEKDFKEEDFIIKNSFFLRKEFAFKDAKLTGAMEKLTQLQKTVLFLMFIVEFDYKTISDILKKKQSTIRGIVFRSINILKSELRND
jgi:RNA polymerase sigma-70 factor (ECF subfamily)